ncbi:MAG: right-handed parallel beta-helix repeat-containing protein [Treponema sp.]|jgi:hypothetical protein|nr:right-handed parallel beta-helix repeat-containing protein [Treponema sp.]
MKRKIIVFFLLLFFTSLFFSGCFSPWREEAASLTLNLGGSPINSRAAVSEAILSQMAHIIELNGPTGRQSHTVEGANQLTVTVMPGYWEINIQAYLNGILCTEGSGGADIKAGQNNTVAIRMNPIDDLEYIVFNTSDDIEYDEYIPGSLRYAIQKAFASQDMVTIRIMLPPGEEIKLKNTLYVDNRNLVIEGNGITLSNDETLPGSDILMTVEKNDDNLSATIRRVRFKNSNGGAIENNGDLILESCIFSGNNADITRPNGEAIYNNGTLDMKGCTFYNNHAGDSGGVIYNYGQIKLTGNLFYENIANNSQVITPSMNGIVTSCGYNAIDVELGTGSTQSGWTAVTGDTTFTELGITTPIDTDTFRPVLQLKNFMPSSPLADFPPADFYGNKRKWPGAPGAVDCD